MNDAETKAIQEGCPPEYQWIKDGVCVMSKRGIRKRGDTTE